MASLVTYHVIVPSVVRNAVVVTHASVTTVENLVTCRAIAQTQLADLTGIVAVVAVVYLPVDVIGKLLSGVDSLTP